jgi:Bacterial regulatory helix-turn-helix protein, lysR family.
MDAQLVQFATVRQLELLKAVEKYGSNNKAAKALGLQRRTVDHALQSLRAKAAFHGVAPGLAGMNGQLSGVEVLKGRSIYFDVTKGVAEKVWIKTDVDAERRAKLLQAAHEALADDLRGLAPLVAPPEGRASDLMTVIPMGDPHFGMYAWAKETGDNFDTETAKRLTLGAVDRLLSVTPNSDTCVILPLGDVFHANDQTNQTPAHKNPLDVDTRFVRVLQIGIQAYRQAVLRALERHRKVIVKFVAGNHDPQAIWALAFSIAAYFDQEPRVRVDLDPGKFWFLQFGKVLIGATHGDTVKPEALEGVMAADMPAEWGKTKHRYWYTGHIHSSNKKEFRGCTWESFRTLAAQDAYAAGHGYRAGRDMLAIIHHREHGEIERHRCDVGMLA